MTIVSKSSTPKATARRAPGPGIDQTVRGMISLNRPDIIQSYVDLWRAYGDVARIRVGPMVIHQFVRPEHVRHIMVSNVDNYPKGASHDKLRIALGNGLLTSDGPFWQRQRRLMQPSYTPRGVTRFADIMTDSGQEMLQRWREPAKSGKMVAVNQEMLRLTMSIISRSMFDVDISQDYRQAGDALVRILEFTAERSLSFVDPPLFLPTPGNRRYQHALKSLDEFLYGIIDNRQKQPPGDDLLSILMTAKDEETGQSMTRQHLRDEVMITFFAGHETTATLLTWTWYLLSRHPHVEEKLHAELAAVLNGRTPTVADTPNLVYTRMIIDEVLRLYSPVAIVARDPLEDDVIDGYSVPAGSLVTITPYLTHRHPELWDNPEGFMPERFAPELESKRPRYAYYPFGAGQRICLGQHFALLEGVLVLADVAQRYRLQAVPGLQVYPKFVGALRPATDVLMTLHERA